MASLICGHSRWRVTHIRNILRRMRGCLSQAPPCFPQPGKSRGVTMPPQPGDSANPRAIAQLLHLTHGSVNRPCPTLVNPGLRSGSHPECLAAWNSPSEWTLCNLAAARVSTLGSCRGPRKRKAGPAGPAQKLSRFVPSYGQNPAARAAGAKTPSQW